MPLLFRGHISSAIGRAETILVAASNAPPHVKAVSSFICDGVADNVEIQAAIDAVNGGVVQLSEGNFNISATLTSLLNFTLRGMGLNTTTITTTVSPAIQLGSAVPGQGLQDSVLEKFRINSSGVLDRGVVAYQVTRCRFDLSIVDFRYPFQLNGTGGFTAVNSIDGGFFRVNQANGIGIELTNISNGNAISPNCYLHILGNGTGTAISLASDCHQNVIFACDLDNWATGISFLGTDNVAIAPRSEMNIATFINYGASHNIVLSPTGSGLIPTEAQLFDGSNLWLGTGTEIARMVRRQSMIKSETLTGWTAAVTGSGTTSSGPNIQNVATGAVGGGGTALLRTQAYGLETVKSNRLFNFSNRLEIKVVGSLIDAFASGVARWTFGKISTDGIGNPTARAIGFRLDNNALNGIVHDGTTLTVVNLNTTWTTTHTNEVAIVSVGGTVSWFFNNVLVGSTTLGPTGDSQLDPQWQVEVTNAGAATNETFYVHSLQWWR